MTSRVAVFASGGGTNLQAILDHFTARGSKRAGDVVLVGSDRAQAGALDRAKKAGIATVVLKSKHDESACEPLAAIKKHRVDFLALAGYLKQVPTDVLTELPSR